MWDTNTFWFDLFLVTLFLLVGNNLMGHFEERSPRARKVLKSVLTLVLSAGILQIFASIVLYVVLGAGLVGILIVHGILLPRKGINGWTAQPLDKYYEFRGWDKDIFKSNK